MRKLTPVKLSANSEAVKQLGTQEISRETPLSRDPKNFPVFRVPVNKKVLVYVPNHVVMNSDGVEELRMDKPYIHTISYKNRWEYYRCTANIVDEENGFDGSCPFCDASPESWDLANLQIEDKCKSHGYSVDDSDNESVKKIKSEAYSNRVLNDAERYYTFPIVVFDTLNDDGKTFVKTEDGKSYVYKIMWYSIREGAYVEKWLSLLENLEDEPTNPGGRFFTLDYTYTPKKGEPNARDSARNLKVFQRVVKGSESMRKALDAQTEDWTPEKAVEVVIRNNLYTPKDLEGVVDECMETTRNLIAIYKAKKEGISAAGIDGGVDDGFSLEKKSTDPSAPVEMDETDEDEGLDVG